MTRFVEVDEDRVKVDNWDRYLEESKVQFDLRYKEVLKSDLTIDDFFVVKTIAVGRFSHWIVAQVKMNKEVYILDVRDKRQTVDELAVNCALEEKKILHATDFPFCMRLLFSFQDASYLYKCLPLFNGGSLFYFLKRLGSFTEPVMRFFTAQVVLGLEYLHHMGVVLRNLTPESILLDGDGYVRLSGFSFAKRIDAGRTYTLCGVREYLAPEALTCQGYGRSVDWWALGVLLHELGTGRPPLVGRDTPELFAAILAAEVAVDEELSPGLQALLQTLLERDLTRRCGGALYRDPAGHLKTHHWYKGVDWLALLAKEVRSPFQPGVSGPDDLSLLLPVKDVPMQIPDKSDQYAKYFEDF